MTRLYTLCTVAVVASGCTKGGGGPQIKSAAEQRPDALFEAKATLNYGGMPVPVSVRRVEEPPIVKFVLEAHGQALETEIYRASDTAFSLVSAIDQEFQPPLDLMRFPMKVGDTWEWSGKLAMGTLSHTAKAKVESSREMIFPQRRGELDTVRIEVRLEIDSGASAPAVRDLTFWFASKQGIVQRKFGPGATERIPFVEAPEKKTPEKSAPPGSS